jgi:hypothetical protein
VRLATTPLPDAPGLLAVHATSGAGGYALLGLGQGSASAAAVLAHVEALARDGREVAALQLAAAYAGFLPRAPARAEVLVASGRLAESLADRLEPGALPMHDRAAQLLGKPIFTLEAGRVRYRGAFEARVSGDGRAADEAALRLVRLAQPCSPAAVAARAAAFGGRRPSSAPDLREEARLHRARAFEEAYFAGPPDGARLRAAVEAWRRVPAAGRYGAEAKARLRALGAKAPVKGQASPVCG